MATGTLGTLTKLTKTNGAALAVLPDLAKTTARIDALVADIAANVDALAREADAIKIKDEPTKIQAGNLRATLGGLKRRIESGLRDCFEPWRTAEKVLRAKLTAPTEQIEKAIAVVGGKIAVRMEAEQRAADEEARKENARLAKLHQQQVKRAEAAEREAPPPPPKVEVVVSSKVGAMTVRRVWDYKIVNPQHVPAAFLDVKRGAVLAALAEAEKDGLADERATEAKPLDAVIPGLLVFKRVSA